MNALILRQVLAPVFLALAPLAGCTPNEASQTGAAVCQISAGKAPDTCPQSVLEEYAGTVRPAGRGVLPTRYLLSFVEFDHQGKAQEPAQKEMLFRRMAQEMKAAPLSIVTFVHGWKHDARGDDPDVMRFRILLTAIANHEAQLPPQLRRNVVVVYAGHDKDSEAILTHRPVHESEGSCTPRAAPETARKCWARQGRNQRGLVYALERRLSPALT